MGGGGLQAANGQVTNAGETPSRGKIQDGGPLFEGAFLPGIEVSKQRDEDQTQACC